MISLLHLQLSTKILCESYYWSKSQKSFAKYNMHHQILRAAFPGRYDWSKNTLFDLDAKPPGSEQQSSIDLIDLMYLKA